MNRYPQRGSSGQFPSRSSHPNPSNMFIPPPPLPPWTNQPRFLPPMPPPPTPPNFPSHPFPPNVAPPFPPHTFQGNRAVPPGPQHSMFRPLMIRPIRPPTNEINMQAPFINNKSTGQTSESQMEVDDWLRKRRISTKLVKCPPKTTIQVHAVRESLNVALSLISELENGARTLSVMVKTVTPAEWEQKCHEIELKKKKLISVLSELNLKEEDLKTFKEKFTKRTKKRERLKRQKEKWKKQKEEEKVMIQNRHVQMDNWLKEMQEGVERIQREEELKKEADAVLWGITQKKNEARRQVALLTALLELRQVRVKRLTAGGRPVSDTQVQVFNTVIERLQNMWSKHLEDIGLEEQALRGMLTQVEVTDDSLKTHKRLVLHKWETAIFGSVGTLDSGLPRGKLVEVRRCWDQFAVPEHTVLSSTIPPGWVLPVAPSTEEWRGLLKY